MSRITVWRMRIACWIPKATNAHLECVIIIVFPLQHRLDERASMLRYRFSACLVFNNFFSNFVSILYAYLINCVSDS
jgi:hypothetical protein